MLNINMSIRESLGNLPSQYAESGSIKKKNMAGHDNNGCCVALALIITHVCAIGSLCCGLTGCPFATICEELHRQGRTRGSDDFSQKDLNGAQLPVSAT